MLLYSNSLPLNKQTNNKDCLHDLVLKLPVLIGLWVDLVSFLHWTLWHPSWQPRIPGAQSMSCVWDVPRSVKSKHVQSLFDLDLWPMTLTYKPRLASINVDPHARKQDSRSNGIDRRGWKLKWMGRWTEGWTDGRTLQHVQSASSPSFAVDNQSMKKKRVIVHNALENLYHERNNTNMFFFECALLELFCFKIV